MIHGISFPEIPSEIPSEMPCLPFAFPLDENSQDLMELFQMIDSGDGHQWTPDDRLQQRYGDLI